VIVRVSDTGRGIHPSFLPSIFDRFRRAETGTTRSEGGLGLGLSIARQLVEMHGGTLTAESPGEEQGATFVMRLPRLTPSGGGLRRAAAPAARATEENASR
jgi:signal transduction histidine kinase